MNLSAKDVTLDLAIRRSFQVLGAVVILAVGVLVARWSGQSRPTAGSEARAGAARPKLMVRVVRYVVMVFTLVAALDKFGFQIAPLVAGIRGGRLWASASRFRACSPTWSPGSASSSPSPSRSGSISRWRACTARCVEHRELFSTTLHHFDRSRSGHPQPEDRGRDPAQLRDHQAA